MEDDRKKIKEPFEPDKTPKPPQEVNAATDRSRENAGEENERKRDPQSKGPASSDKQHLLDEETDIDDETTI